MVIDNRRPLLENDPQTPPRKTISGGLLKILFSSTTIDNCQIGIATVVQ